MDNDEKLEDDFSEEETGSDELLAADDLRLPESADILVRLHAVRAWLERQRKEATLDVGRAALALQEAMESPVEELRPRRRAMREGDSFTARLNAAQQALRKAQERLSAYEEAQSLLEDCVAHTSGQRVLVEYYLTLEELLTGSGYALPSQETTPDTDSPWYDVMLEVMQRIEHVTTPQEEE
ncbi:MAG TPA: hypothetical protein VFA41_10915 [Ktedonobacteraceae bacterium]|jgi:chromosome segregation ATPase|nr:hypothetical protein [Ktedonobacteraceae bacterium]